VRHEEVCHDPRIPVLTKEAYNDLHAPPPIPPPKEKGPLEAPATLKARSTLDMLREMTPKPKPKPKPPSPPESVMDELERLRLERERAEAERGRENEAKNKKRKADQRKLLRDTEMQRALADYDNEQAQREREAAERAQAEAERDALEARIRQLEAEVADSMATRDEVAACELTPCP